MPDLERSSTIARDALRQLIDAQLLPTVTLENRAVVLSVEAAGDVRRVRCGWDGGHVTFKLSVFPGAGVHRSNDDDEEKDHWHPRTDRLSWAVQPVPSHAPVQSEKKRNHGRWIAGLSASRPKAVAGGHGQCAAEPSVIAAPCVRHH